MIKRFFLLMACLGFFSHPAFAKVQITGVSDINLGTWTLSSMSGNDPVCVYESGGSQAYAVTATDNSTITPQGFYLQNAGNQLPYTLTWGNTPSPGSTVLQDGIPANASGANKISRTCRGGNSANLKVDISNSSIAAIPAGTYTATVTVLIAP